MPRETSHALGAGVRGGDPVAVILALMTTDPEQIVSGTPEVTGKVV